VHLPGAELGHVTLSAATMRDVAFLRKKILGKLERTGQLNAAKGVAQEKIEKGVFVVTGSEGKVKLTDGLAMAQVLAMVQPYLAPAPVSGPRTALLELHCPGLPKPVVPAEDIARFVNPRPGGGGAASTSASASSSAASAPEAETPGKPLQHTSTSRPKRAARAKRQPAGAGAAGISKFDGSVKVIDD